MIQFYRSLILLTLVILPGSPMSLAQTSGAKADREAVTQAAAADVRIEKAKTVEPNGAGGRKTAAHPSVKKPDDGGSQREGLDRWVELQAATVGFRFRHVTNSAGVTTTRQLQHQEAIKGRFKFDAAGRYSLHVGVFSGDSFSGSWSNTGAGTGHPSGKLRLKQIYFAAEPFKGVEEQYGSLYVARGENTEITTYDNDAYITGQRLSFRRAPQLFFDEVTITYAYLGDVNAPSFFRRWRRLSQSNYHQFLVVKKLGQRAAVSADYTFHNGAETLHQAAKVNAGELRIVDSVRFENYQRLDVRPNYGFAVSAEKKLSKRLSLGGGYADIDSAYGGLNADRFNKGKRVFASGSFALTPELGVSAFGAKGVSDAYTTSNQTRLDVIVSYDILKAVRRAGFIN